MAHCNELQLISRQIRVVIEQCPRVHEEPQICPRLPRVFVILEGRYKHGPNGRLGARCEDVDKVLATACYESPGAVVAQRLEAATGRRMSPMHRHAACGENLEYVTVRNGPPDSQFGNYHYR